MGCSLNCWAPCSSPYKFWIWALKGLRTGLIKGFFGISTLLLSSILRFTLHWFVWWTMFYLLGSIRAETFWIGAILNDRVLGARNLFGVGALSSRDSKSMFGRWLYILKLFGRYYNTSTADLCLSNHKIPVQKHHFSASHSQIPLQLYSCANPYHLSLHWKVVSFATELNL